MKPEMPNPTIALYQRNKTEATWKMHKAENATKAAQQTEET